MLHFCKQNGPKQQTLNFMNSNSNSNSYNNVNKHGTWKTKSTWSVHIRNLNSVSMQMMPRFPDDKLSHFDQK